MAATTATACAAPALTPLVVVATVVDFATSLALYAHAFAAVVVAA